MALRSGHCCLCGACTCVPDDETLVMFYDDSSPYKPITDDDVPWLRSFRIMGKLKFRLGTRPLQDDGDHPEDTSPTAFLTGPVRARGSKVEFLRDTAAGVEFGGCTSVSGAGPDEVLSVSRKVLEGYLSVNEFQNELLVIHSICYDEIFRRVVDYVERRARPRGTKIGGPLKCDNVHACLKRTRLAAADFSCAFYQEPGCQGTKKTEAELEEERLLMLRKRRVSYSLYIEC